MVLGGHIVDRSHREAQRVASRRHEGHEPRRLDLMPGMEYVLLLGG